MNVGIKIQGNASHSLINVKHMLVLQQNSGITEVTRFYRWKTMTVYRKITWRSSQNQTGGLMTDN